MQGRRCASTVRRSPRCTAPRRAHSSVRVFRTGIDTGPVTIEHDGAPARGWVIDLAGRPVAPFEGEIELRPWQVRDAATRVTPTGRVAQGRNS